MLFTLLVGVAFLQEPATDPLEKQITIRADVEQLGVVAEELSKQIGLSIEVTPKVREELVILYAKERPAKEVLMRLASHFGWEWEKTAQGYRLVQSPSSESQEKRLLEESILNGLKTYQEQAKKELERISKANKSEIEKKIEDIQKKIDEIESQEREGEESVELFRSRWESLSPLYRELRDLEEQIDPYKHLVYTLVASLSSQQLLELEKRHRLVFSTHPTRAQYAFTPSTQNVITTFVDEIVETQKKEAAKQKEYIERQKAQGEADEEWMEMPELWWIKTFELKDVAAVRIALRSPSLGSKRGSMDAVISILGVKGDILVDEYSWLVVKAGAETKNGENKEDSKKEENQNPVQDQLDKPLDPEGFKKAWVELPVDFPIFEDFLKPDSKKDPLTPFGMILNEAASQSNVALIADAYDVYSEAPLPRGNDVKTARKLFDTYGESTNCEWKFENGWVTIRNREWALARALTIPRNLLFSIRDIYFKQCGLNFEQMAWLASNLTDRQCSSILLLVVVAPWMSKSFVDSVEIFSFLRMWANLSPVQKEILKAGKALSFADLNPVAKNHLSEYLYRKGRIDERRFYGPYFEEDDEENPAKVAESELEMPVMAFDMNDQEVTQVLPDGVPPGTQILLTLKQRAGIATLIKSKALRDVEIPYVFSTERFTEYEWESSDLGTEMEFTLEKDRLKPATLERWSFNLKLLPEVNDEVSFGIAYSHPSQAFGAIETLPLDLQKKITKQREELRKKRDDGDPGKEVRL